MPGTWHMATSTAQWRMAYGVWPMVFCMYEHRTTTVLLEVSNAALGNSILNMGINTTMLDALSKLASMRHEKVLSKPTIVAVVKTEPQFNVQPPGTFDLYA